MSVHLGLKTALRTAAVLSLLAIPVLTGPAAEGVGSPPAPALSTPPDGSGCYASVQNPHYSSGNGGVIAKPYWYCDGSHAGTVNSYLGTLYRCPTQPNPYAGESAWTGTYGCSPHRSVNSVQVPFNVGPGATVIRYIPANGQAGGTPGAWWVACVRGYWSNGQGFAGVSQAAYA